MTSTVQVTGVVGQRWRAEVTPSGAIVPFDGAAPLEWYVAAEDRWHDPAKEATLRQRRIDGAPVFETRLRVPRGDVVSTVWSVADGGGLTLVELHNDSPLAVAVALTTPDVLTSRPPADVPVDGIDLPAGSIVLPIGHGTSVLVGLGHERRAAGRLPQQLPTPDRVVSGWTVLASTASRLDVPDESWRPSLVAARCDLQLVGPPAIEEDPVGAVLAIVELVRMGAAPDPWVPELATAVERCARLDGWDVDLAMERAGVAFAAAGERRALADVGRVIARRAERAGEPLPDESPDGVRAVAWVESQLVRRGELLPTGIPDGWRGTGIEAFGLPTAPATTVSFAVRWHGERPAVLWDQRGSPVTLTAPTVDPSWSSRAVRGEALWDLDDRLGA